MYLNHFCISGVGKTSLVRRYTEDKWNPAGTASTTGAFFVTHKTDFKGTRVKLQIWDTAGKFFVLPYIWFSRCGAIAVGRFAACSGSISARPRWSAGVLDLRDRRLIVVCLPLLGAFRRSGGAYHLMCNTDRGFKPSILYRRTRHECTLLN